MNPAAELLARVEGYLLQGDVAGAEGVGLVEALTQVSDADLAACAGSAFLSEALRFERGRRAGTVERWRIHLHASAVGAIHFGYSVLLTEPLKYIVSTWELPGG